MHRVIIWFRNSENSNSVYYILILGCVHYCSNKVGWVCEPLSCNFAQLKGNYKSNTH